MYAGVGFAADALVDSWLRQLTGQTSGTRITQFAIAPSNWIYPARSIPKSGMAAKPFIEGNAELVEHNSIHRSVADYLTSSGSTPSRFTKVGRLCVSSHDGCSTYISVINCLTSVMYFELSLTR